MTLLLSWKSSSRKLVMIHVMPMKRLMTMRKMYAVLGSVKTNDAGYIIGVMDHLNEYNHHINNNHLIYTETCGVVAQW